MIARGEWEMKIKTYAGELVDQKLILKCTQHIIML